LKKTIVQNLEVWRECNRFARKPQTRMHIGIHPRSRRLPAM